MTGRVQHAILAALLCLGGSGAYAQVAGDSVIHDPSQVIRDGNRYYVYSTALGGNDGIFFKYSTDLVTWHDPGGNAAQNAIFSTAPAWIASEVPNNDGTFWAPSVLKYGSEYRMYYSASTFGTQESAIGLATNVTLDYTSPNYQWVDRGMVIDSEVGYAYNTIDPSVFVDADSRMWMTFGSYWQGIYITELNPTTGMPLNATQAGATRIASRGSGGSDIEASYMHYHDGQYYLFVNWGQCCQGVDSTYEIRVGRSSSPTGPFYDDAAVPVDMRNGGGTLFLDDVGAQIGPGHAGILTQRGVDYFGYHYYDGNSNGLPRYEIDTLLWTADGWPLLLAQAMLADLNRDALLNGTDWQIFASNSLTSLSSYSLAEQQQRGDLDRDGDNDFADFRLFQTYYDAVHGAGSLALAQGSQVPEPATLWLAAAAVPLVVQRCRFARSIA